MLLKDEGIFGRGFIKKRDIIIETEAETGRKREKTINGFCRWIKYKTFVD